MDELISRQAAIDAIQNLNIPEDMCVFEIMSHIEVEIATLPSAQPKRGKWKPRYYDVGADVYVEWACSECGYVRQNGREDGSAGEEPEADFCEKCGVKMER